MSLDNFNDYTGKKWLEPIDVKTEDHAFIIVGVEEVERDDEKKLVLQLNSEDFSGDFSLNMTNARKCAEFVDSPKKLIGKAVYFNKVKTTSPKTKKEIDALRIYNIV